MCSYLIQISNILQKYDIICQKSISCVLACIIIGCEPNMSNIVIERQLLVFAGTTLVFISYMLELTSSITMKSSDTPHNGFKQIFSKLKLVIS